MRSTILTRSCSRCAAALRGGAGAPGGLPAQEDRCGDIRDHFVAIFDGLTTTEAYECKATLRPPPAPLPSVGAAGGGAGGGDEEMAEVDSRRAQEESDAAMALELQRSMEAEDAAAAAASAAAAPDEPREIAAGAERPTEPDGPSRKEPRVAAATETYAGARVQPLAPRTIVAPRAAGQPAAGSRAPAEPAPAGASGLRGGIAQVCEACFMRVSASERAGLHPARSVICSKCFGSANGLGRVCLECNKLNCVPRKCADADECSVCHAKLRPLHEVARNAAAPAAAASTGLAGVAGGAGAPVRTAAVVEGGAVRALAPVIRAGAVGVVSGGLGGLAARASLVCTRAPGGAPGAGDNSSTRDSRAGAGDRGAVEREGVAAASHTIHAASPPHSDAASARAVRKYAPVVRPGADGK